MVRIVAGGCALVALAAGCVSPSPAPEVVVYTGPIDPAYSIPDRVRQQLQSDREARRLAIARFQADSGPVYARVQRDPHFGGFLFVHDPAPHAIVMFTGDAEARLKRYTNDSRFKARRVELTLATLERQKDAMSAELARLGLRCFTVDADEQHNRVTVTTPEVDRVQRAITEGQVKRPQRFALLPGGCPQLR